MSLTNLKFDQLEYITIVKVDFSNTIGRSNKHFTAIVR